MKQAFLLFFLALVWSQAGTISAQTPTNGDIRLVGGGSSRSGRLDIFLDGKWGSVCYNKVSTGAAQAACKQLGYSDVEKVDTVEKMGYAHGTGPIQLKNVYCSPNSGFQHILRCTYIPLNDSCNHSMDMAITCSSSLLSPYDTAVRLVDGGTGFPSSGIAEVYLHNQWGTICDDLTFDHEAASTICRQLSYTGSTAYTSTESSAKVWLSNFYCLSDQQCLDVCSGFTYPSAGYSGSCSEVVVVNCTFDITDNDNLPGSEGSCTGYWYLVNNLRGIIIGAVVAFIFICLIFILVPIIICCCCIQGCLFYNYRPRRVVYQVIQ